MKKKTRRNKKKKRIISIISVIAALLIISSLIIFYVYFNKHKYSFKLKDAKSVSLNTKVNPKDYIKTIKNAKVTYNDIDTSTIGEKEIKYVVTDTLFKKKHKYTIKVKVVDDISPTIEGKTEISIYINSKIDLNSYIKVTDNYDKDVKITTKGDVDISKKGTYKVEYTAKDSSNNESKHTITFTVKEKAINEPVSLPNGVVGKTSKGYTIENKNGATYIGGYLVANKTYPLSSTYGSGLTGSTKSAFEEMKAAAILDGFDLYIGSGYRSYNTQKTIYNNYVKRDGQAKADTYSARAGHSEHQSGLAIDICDRTVKACINSNYNDTASAKWLSDNAYKYGFILRYPNGKTNETGYKFESWHYRYVGKELASTLYNGGSWITMEDYFGFTSKYE